MINGVIVINKPQQFTSFDVVAKMRGILHEKKIGHGGTLDPMATGVLPVLIGNATKAADILPDDEKTYDAELTLGLSSETEDIFGEEVREVPIPPLSEEEVQEAILSFVGVYDQIPPMVSAKKVNGKKLYEYARRGEVIERAPVRLFIRSIEIREICLPRIRFSVTCSKGTYIRTLCTDIARRLHTEGVMSGLIRARHGCFTLKDSKTIGEVEEAVKQGKLSEILRPVESLFPDLRAVRIDAAHEKYLRNGNELREEDGLFPQDLKTDELLRVYDSAERFTALYRVTAAGTLKPYKMFKSE